MFFQKSPETAMVFGLFHTCFDVNALNYLNIKTTTLDKKQQYELQCQVTDMVFVVFIT